MARTAERQRQMPDMWPGFVDALAALLVVIIFLVMIFTVAQFFLSELLLGRDRALDSLNRQVAALSEQLELEQARAVRLRWDLEARIAGLGQELADRDDIVARLLASSRELETLLAAEKARLGATERDLAERTGAVEAARAELAEERAARTASQRQIERLALQMARLRENLAKYEETVSRMRARSRELDASLAAARERSGRAEREAEEGRRRLAEERKAGAAVRERVRAVSRELADLRREFARLNAALEASETTREEQRIRLDDLGKRLREALVSRVTELARYRSEFFGRLREVLGSEESVRIVGDRFVFQSEILFPSGAADFNPTARRRIDGLADTLREVTGRIPESIDWVLRIDGHTDRAPIRTPQFPSNWELSTARAISVVRALIERGIPANRLVAAGFGANYPLDEGDTVKAYRRNRRIELKLTQR